MTPHQRTLWILAAAIIGVLSLVVFTKTLPRDATGDVVDDSPSSIGFIACDPTPYTSCIKCCEGQADTLEGKDAYGQVRWSDAYNACWQKYCRTA